MAVGAATILGSFAARLGLDTSEYRSGILESQALNAAFGSSFTNFVTNPLLGSIDLFRKGASAVLGYAKGLTTGVLESAESIQRLSQQTGASTELLQALATRMEVAGFNAEQGGKGILVLAKNMEEARQNGGPFKDLLDRLGVSLAPGQPIDVGLAQLLDGLARLPDEGVRSAVAMRLLGEEAGPRLVNAVGGGSEALRQMIREGRQLGSVWGRENVDLLAAGNTALGYTQQAVANVQRQLAVQFIAGFLEQFGTGTESVTDLADKINTDLGPAVRRLGSDLGAAATDLRSITGDLKSLIDVVSGATNAVSYIGPLIPTLVRGDIEGQSLTNELSSRLHRQRTESR